MDRSEWIEELKELAVAQNQKLDDEMITILWMKSGIHGASPSGALMGRYH